MKQADEIRTYATARYVAPARKQRVKRFSIRTGDVVRDMKLAGGRAPAVCSALKTKEFLNENVLRLVSRTGPEQSTTVIYTYEFADDEGSSEPRLSGAPASAPVSPAEAWEKLRGALKDVFSEYGGGEAYLREERISFRDRGGRR